MSLPGFKIIVLSIVVVVTGLVWMVSEIASINSMADQAAVRNHIMNFRRLRQASDLTINRVYKRMIDEGRSHHPVVQTALSHAQKVMDFRQQADSLIVNIGLYKHDYDLANSYFENYVPLARSFRSFAETALTDTLFSSPPVKLMETLFNERLFSVDPRLPGNRWLPPDGDLIELSALQLGRGLDDFCHYAIEYLSSYVGATAIKFDIAPPELRWKKGLIEFNPPVIMQVGKTERLEVRIAGNLEEDLKQQLKGAGVPQVDTIHIGDIMSVKLTGDNFTITAFDEDEQGVTKEGFTQWEFDITPQQSGLQHLYLKVGIVYYVPNLGPAKKFFPVYDKDIEVRIGFWSQLGLLYNRYWEFILGSIVIPILAWFFPHFRKRLLKKGTGSGQGS
jgi:hypothetical protein